MQPLSCDLWLMDRVAFDQFPAFMSFKIDAEQARAVAQASPKREKKVGILPVHGALEARPSFIGELLGMSSYEQIGYGFDSLMADETVSSVVLDVASPGGMVYGAQELAEKIFQSRGRKPIVAVANPMAASGAYWIAAAADRIVVMPSGDVGSIGVIAEHMDFSKALENEGVKATVIRSKNSPNKGEHSQYEPLSEESKARLQARADAISTKFVADVARFRGVTPEYVVENFGGGSLVDSKRAIAAGMADRTGTLAETVYKLIEGRIRIGSERAQDEWDGPTPKDRFRAKSEAFKVVANTQAEVTAE